MTENFEEMELEGLITSQMRDDRPYANPEANGGVYIRPMGDKLTVLADLFRQDDDSVRLPVERRPNVSGVPNIYDTVDAWTPKLRFGPKPRTRGPSKGCKRHGLEYWRTPTDRGGQTRRRDYCTKCHHDRRLIRLGREAEITE